MNYKELKAALTGLGDFERKSNDDLMATARAAYDPQYANDLQNLRDSLTQQLAQQQRSAVSNGMQRSSYNQAAQAALGTGGLRSQADLAGTYEGNVATLYAQLLQNEDNREDTYNANKNNLLLQLYNINHKTEGSGGGSSGSSTGDTTPLNIPASTETPTGNTDPSKTDPLGSLLTPKSEETITIAGTPSKIVKSSANVKFAGTANTSNSASTSSNSTTVPTTKTIRQSKFASTVLKK